MVNLLSKAAYLGIGFQVVVEDIDADGEIASVVRVGPVPALWPKLPPLHHYCVEIHQREQDAFELVLTRTHLKCVLKKHSTVKSSRVSLLSLCT